MGRHSGFELFSGQPVALTRIGLLKLFPYPCCIHSRKRAGAMKMGMVAMKTVCPSRAAAVLMAIAPQR